MNHWTIAHLIFTGSHVLVYGVYFWLSLGSTKIYSALFKRLYLSCVQVQWLSFPLHFISSSSSLCQYLVHHLLWANIFMNSHNKCTGYSSSGEPLIDNFYFPVSWSGRYFCLSLFSNKIYFCLLL